LAELDHKAWKGATDGTPWMHRSLIGLFRWVPLRVMYGVMATAIPVYVLADGKGRVASYRFFRRRMGYGPFKSACHVFRNMYNMGKAVMDRFAAYAGREFRMTGDNQTLYDALVPADVPFMLLASHVGNYEISGYMLRTPKPMKTLVYSGEAVTVMQNRARMFGDCNIEMVPVREDLSHIFVLNAALSSGGIVSMPADRALGSAKSVRCRFFGEEAAFPAGPFTLAVRRGATSFAVFVVKEDIHTFRAIVERLEVTGQESTAQKVQALADAYAASLERVARAYPDQWFNFYDFWK